MRRTCVILIWLIFILIIVSLGLTLFQKSLHLKSKVAVVRIEGPIMGSKDAVDEIKGFAKDSSVKAIILRIDSPGGAVAPSQEIYAEVKKAAQKKGVVVSMGAVAASGGYYIASPATKILANPGSLTGSIGVIMEIPNVEGLMSKIGIKTEIIKSGRNKDMASVFRSIKPEQREILQGVMDNVHEQFIRAVAEGRKMKVEKVRELADGRVFTGEQALENGLVDQLGTLDDAVNVAAKLGGIAGEPEVISKKDKLSFIDILSNKIPKQLADLAPTVAIKYLYLP